jgi:hypothetical protein
VKTAKVEVIWQAPPVGDVKAVAEPVKSVADRATPVVGHATPVVDRATPLVTADTSKKPARVSDTATAEKEREWNRMLEQQRAELEVQQQQLNEERDRLAKRAHELEVEQARLNLKFLQAQSDTAPLLQLREHNKYLLLDAQTKLDLMNHNDMDLIAKNQQLLKENELRLDGLARLQLLQTPDEAGNLGTSRDKILKPFLRMLVDKGLVTQLDEVSFSLDNKEFIVNDKKQSGEVFEAFRNRFIHSSKDYVKYSRRKGSESSSINQEHK